MSTKSYTDDELKQISNVVKFIKNNGDFIAFEVGNQKFNLTIPKDKDSSYFIELSIVLKGYEWLNRINEFIFEKNPDLNMIISHIETKYDEQKKSSITSKNITFPNIPDSNIDMFDLQEQRYRRIIETNLDKLKTNITLTTDANKTKEIFTRKTTANVIMGEFFKLRKKYQDKRIELVLNEDNIYHWKIKFNKFENQNIQTQFEKLTEKHQYSYIEMEIHFHDTLYPNYPPFVHIVRPRLENSLMHRITNMRMIQFEYWTPCRGMEFIMNKIYNALNNNCVIDINSDMNNPTKYPSGAYHPFESVLIKLASLCDIKDEYEPLDKEEYKTTKITSKKKATKSTNKTVWNSGVGYGTSASPQWDMDEYLRLQREKDQQIQSVLTTIIDNLQNYSDDEMALIYKIIKSSYLIPFIKSYINGTNTLDMSKHVEIYKLFFTFLQIITTEDSMFLFDDVPSPSDSLFGLLKKLYQETKTVTKFIANKEPVKNTKDSNADSDDFDICSMVCVVYEMIEPLYNKYLETKTQHNDQEKKNLIDKIENAKNSGDPTHQLYKDTMEKLKFDTTKFTSNYTYVSSNSTNSKVMRRLSHEFGMLMKDLPILFQTSIFVRVDEQNNKRLKVLITGTDNTPYDSGCFIFDLYTGDNYPNNNPQMIFRNTGNKRFNPNLYKCGKVCLSLLGTWDGANSEKWNPENSTLKQLLFSIQSQILVEQPYYNEPGYESTYNTALGKRLSYQYNLQIRAYTLQHAILDLLQKPETYSEFTDVIKNHFKLKKEYIKELINKWSDEANKYDQDADTNKTKDETGSIIKFYDMINTIGKKIITELDKLN